MATEIIMPKVDMVMETGTFSEWLVEEGTTVKKGDPIFVMTTDKAAIEVESPASGILSGISAKTGDVIPVTDVVGYILEPGESLPEKGKAVKEVKEVLAEVVEEKTDVVPETAKAVEKIEARDSLVRATPLARALAKERGIDLAAVEGRGPRGRIYKADVMAASATSGTAATGVFKQAEPYTDVKVNLPNAAVLERVPLTGVREIIAQRLAYSSATIPHINESVDVDMSGVMQMRKRIMPFIQGHTGVKLSYTAILAHAVAKLLVRHPYLNSSLDDGDVVLWKDVNIGIATSIEDYLIVPVVRQAQEKDLESLVVEMDRLLTAARGKKLEPQDMSGSTFTITNLGMFGIESFTAIINPPEAAILAVGKMVDKVVVVDGEIKQRPMMNLTIAADHRINDGVRVANFLNDLKTMLENPLLFT